MKNYYFLLVLVLVGLKSNGQTGPVFQYTNPAKQTIYSLAMESSEKGKAYRDILVEVVSKGLRDTLPNISGGHINWIFNRLFLEEVYLPEAGFKNSGYNPLKKKMIPSIGHEKTMFVWVLRVGTYVLPLIKGDCGNILEVPVKRIEIKTISEDELNPELSKPNVVPERIPENDWIPPGTIRGAAKMEIPDNNQPTNVLISQQQMNKTWVGKNLPWIIPSIVAIGTGLVVADHNDWWRAHPIIVLGGQGVDPPPVGGDGK